MILLDTNVISALMLPTPNAEVIDWLGRQEADHILLSSVTVAEICYGLEALPEGKRRRSLQERFERYLALGFEDRILAFDLPAARMYGELLGHRRAIGRPMSVADGQIAAIARTHGLAVATRNVKDFDECGLVVMNPF